MGRTKTSSSGKSAARQVNARRQPRAGGKFAGPPAPADQDPGPPPAEPAKPPRSGRVGYPAPGDEPVAAEEPAEQAKRKPKPTASRSKKTTASRSKKPARRTPAARENGGDQDGTREPPAPPRRGLLADLADGIAAAFGGRG